jgi:site-specific DNA-methyltransferase (adenine-specific)
MVLNTEHYLLVGDCTKTKSYLSSLPPIDLIITSPPYFNAPFDYKELFSNYETFLSMIDKIAKILFSKLKVGGIAVINIDDMLIKGIKYPIISDTIKIFRKNGYKVNGRIVWRKPEGYIRISRRSGVLLQNPYPMYFYPDNLLESILIFQKGIIKDSEKSTTMIQKDIWKMTNVLPKKGRLESNIAAFPEELPKRLIKAFSIEGSLICDPFLGSGTTMKIARDLQRNSIGIEILPELVEIIQKKTGFSTEKLDQYFDNSELKIETISTNEMHEEMPKNGQKLSFSLISEALDGHLAANNEHLYHLIILDCRKLKNPILNTNLSTAFHKLHPGRILLVYYDFVDNYEEKLTLDQLMDYIMSHGIKLRDKITVQHKYEEQWEIRTNFNSKIRFNHEFYEVLIFQKGKFNYKTKTKEEKIDCTIDKSQFQR